MVIITSKAKVQWFRKNMLKSTFIILKYQCNVHSIVNFEKTFIQWLNDIVKRANLFRYSLSAASSLLSFLVWQGVWIFSSKWIKPICLVSSWLFYYSRECMRGTFKFYPVFNECSLFCTQEIKGSSTRDLIVKFIVEVTRKLPLRFISYIWVKKA